MCCVLAVGTCEFQRAPACPPLSASKSTKRLVVDAVSRGPGQHTQKLAFGMSQRHVLWLDRDRDLFRHSLGLLPLVSLYLTGTLRLRHSQGFPVGHFYTDVFVAHRRQGPRRLASGLSSQVSQEIPGYPQAFQESWKFSNGLTQTRARWAQEARRYSPGWSPCAGVRGPRAVRGLSSVSSSSEEELCFCAARPFLQNLQKVFSVAVPSTQRAARARSNVQVAPAWALPCPRPA